LKPVHRLISLEGQRALITGTATGIGHAIAQRFAEVWAALELVDIDENRLQRIVDALTVHAVDVHPHRVDLAQQSDIADLWSRLTGREPSILVNNAGIYPFTDFLDMDAAAFQAVIDVNLHAVVWMCQHMIRRNADRGGVNINIGSIEALLPFKNGLAHCGSQSSN
jgi:NAD(P)-dependent dehydrogenase (short-subunit alcohol dehydrogenase family)